MVERNINHIYQHRPILQHSYTLTHPPSLPTHASECRGITISPTTGRVVLSLEGGALTTMDFSLSMVEMVGLFEELAREWKYAMVLWQQRSKSALVETQKSGRAQGQGLGLAVKDSVAGGGAAATSVAFHSNSSGGGGGLGWSKDSSSCVAASSLVDRVNRDVSLQGG